MIKQVWELCLETFNPGVHNSSPVGGQNFLMSCSRAEAYMFLHILGMFFMKETI
jgi:hypothetical protein